MKGFSETGNGNDSDRTGHGKLVFEREDHQPYMHAISKVPMEEERKRNKDYIASNNNYVLYTVKSMRYCFYKEYTQ